MKKSKIAVLVAMVVVLAFSLAACGGSDKSSSDKYCSVQGRYRTDIPAV